MILKVTQVFVHSVLILSNIKHQPSNFPVSVTTAIFLSNLLNLILVFANHYQRNNWHSVSETQNIEAETFSVENLPRREKYEYNNNFNRKQEREPQILSSRYKQCFDQVFISEKQNIDVQKRSATKAGRTISRPNDSDKTQAQHSR